MNYPQHDDDIFAIPVFLDFVVGGHSACKTMVLPDGAAGKLQDFLARNSCIRQSLFEWALYF